ncbi:MAG: chemotaxis response regulator protein-glutamate methylesterase [Candidatus Caldatribacterium sp.]|nr:chemotaxis response regulator protein-glutamate methylesterase [Candidatus Caldatribacterium sp.]
MKPIRVMVVDDSVFMRRMVKDLLETDPEITVVALARDGEEALTLLSEVRPDVVLLDVEMPRLNGLEFLERALAKQPLRVIMLSALTQEGSDVTIQALERGALDFIPKPSGAISLDIDRKKDEIIQKVKSVSAIPLERVKMCCLPWGALRKRPHGKEVREESQRIVFVASSTGGPKALQILMQGLAPLEDSGMVLVQHMPPGFTKSLADRLSDLAPFPVREAQGGEAILKNYAFLAPGGKHLLVNGDRRLTLDDSPPLKGLKPCADITLSSLVDVFGNRVLAVVLTGMGKDGLEGCRKLKKVGGKVIAQDEKTSLIFGMPRAVIEEGLADAVLPIEEIGKAIVEWDRYGDNTR